MSRPFLLPPTHALNVGQERLFSIPVSVATALGGKIEAPTLDDGRTRVKVPAGVQSGKQLRLRSKGMPALRGAAAGDLYIELAVETPVNLTERQKDLLREFEPAGRDNNPESQDFFSRVKLLGRDEGVSCAVQQYHKGLLRLLFSSRVNP